MLAIRPSNCTDLAHLSWQHWFLPDLRVLACTSLLFKVTAKGLGNQNWQLLEKNRFGEDGKGEPFLAKKGWVPHPCQSLLFAFI
jgi:hypothetical protein